MSQSIELSASNFDFLKHKKPELKKKSNPLNVNFIYEIPIHTVAGFKAVVEQCSSQEIIKLLTNEARGWSAIQLAMLNKDCAMLEYILSLIDRFKVDKKDIQYVCPESAHTRFSNRFEFKKNETILNIALRRQDLDKVELLLKSGFNDINCHISIDSRNTQTPDLLALMSFYCSNPLRTNVLDRINFFYSVALSSRSFEQILDLSPYRAENIKSNLSKIESYFTALPNSIVEHFIFLLAYEKIYENENFRHLFLPKLLQNLKSIDRQLIYRAIEDKNKSFLPTEVLSKHFNNLTLDQAMIEALENFFSNTAAYVYPESISQRIKKQALDIAVLGEKFLLEQKVGTPSTLPRTDKSTYSKL